MVKKPSVDELADVWFMEQLVSRAARGVGGFVPSDV